MELPFQFVTSDQHFGHEKMVGYDNRPWDSIVEHDAGLVERYNSVVGPDDLVLWLGDCFFFKKPDAEAVMRLLNGRKWLVKGNHDRWTDTAYRKLGFEHVSGTYESLKIRFSHRPEYTLPSGCRYNVHGHTHATNPIPAGALSARNVCVSVTAWDYTPAPTERVLELLGLDSCL